MPTIPTPTQNSLSVLLLPSTIDWIKPQIHYTCSVHRSKLNNNSVITGICCTEHAVQEKNRFIVQHNIVWGGRDKIDIFSRIISILASDKFKNDVTIEASHEMNIILWYRMNIKLID